MKKFLQVLFMRGLILVPAICLTACDPDTFKSPPELKDQQIVCTLTGEAYIFRDYTSPHSVRSAESDVMCAPMKPKAGVN